MGNIGVIILLGFGIVLLSTYVPRFICWFRNRIKYVPHSILIQCPVCSEVHELKIIRILSCWYTGKIVVWCNKKHRGDILYNESKLQ